jgi:hypothetical protein
MHWATPKTKDRMLPDAAAAAAGGSNLSAQGNPQHR